MNRASRTSPVHRLRPSAGAVLVLAFAIAAPDPVLAQSTEDELTRAREGLEDLRQEYRAAQTQVDQIRAVIQSLTNQISQVTSHLEALGEVIEEAQAGVTRSRERAEELQLTLNARARDAYVRGPAGVVELLLNADSLSDLADRFSFLDALSRRDASVAEGLEIQLQELSGLRRSLKEYEAEYERQLSRLEGKDERLNAKWEAEAAAKAALEERVEEAAEIVEELEERLQREYLSRYGMVGAGSAGPPLSADGPFYWCPVDPPRSYVDSFGAPRPGGRSHQGADVFAPESTPIRAAFGGVASEQLDGLGGITVTVDAPNGDHVYNAHMSEWAGVDGQQVQPGDIIGFVGNSGNAAGTPPHDHFQYSPAGSSPVNPTPYLNEVCGVNGSG
ncbi:MAG: murein hydrolase activator EnvC family protein [Actinomycetota bacterium]